MVYYNEFDPKKAAWLRELIKAGAIAKGEVDERSIVDVRPGDLNGFTQCHFFAGIGIWSYALRCAGWPDDREVWTFSCPCQPFSVAGKKAGTADRRHLWPDMYQLIRERKPVVCFGEQVSSPDGLAWLDIVSTDMESSAYTIGAVDLCAPGAGAPHIRNRTFFVADAARGRRGIIGDASQPRSGGHAHGRNCTGVLGDTHEAGSQRRSVGGNGADECAAGPAGVVGSLDYATEIRCTGQRISGEVEPSRNGARLRESSGSGSPCHLGHSESNGRIGRPNLGDGGRRECPPRQAGPVNGFWADAEWVWCRPEGPGKPWTLRPTESGSFPLVNGTPCRVGRLRGFGDGIVSPVAQAFIECYCEERGLVA